MKINTQRLKTRCCLFFFVRFFIHYPAIKKIVLLSHFNPHLASFWLSNRPDVKKYVVRQVLINFASMWVLALTVIPFHTIKYEIVFLQVVSLTPVSRHMNPVIISRLFAITSKRLSGLILLASTAIITTCFCQQHYTFIYVRKEIVLYKKYDLCHLNKMITSL